MATRTSHVFTVAAVCLLIPIILTAQVQRDSVPLKPWPAPLYWQPTPTASQAAEGRLMLAGNAEKRSAASNVTTDAQTPVGALVFVAMTPCRVVDTRTGMGFTGAFGPPSLAGPGTRTFPIQSSPNCSIPSIAQTYSFNVTVVPSGATFPGSVNPSGALGYLTIWPTGAAQPNASTLNSWLGTVAANAAIVPAGTGGSVDVFASDNADLIIDINGYYAPQTGITLAQGTAAAPSISFSGDPGTGIFSSATGTLNIATGGTSRLNVDSGGDVGIGTTTPDGQLQVFNPSGATKLTIGGTSFAGGYTSLVLGSSALSGGYNQIQSVQSSGTSYGVLALNPVDGNIGVGTTTPTARLAVRGDGIDVLVGSAGCGAPTAAIGFGTMSGCTNFTLGVNTNNGADSGTFINRPTGRSIHFRENNASDQMTIVPGGAVGIGTTNPTFGRLEVDGGSSNGVFGSSNGGIGVWGQSLGVGSAKGVNGSSDIGIGVEGFSSSGMGVKGSTETGWAVWGATTGGGLAGRFDGNVLVTGCLTASNLGCPSDARLKEDIRPLAYGLPEVLRLRPVTWQWKDATKTEPNLGLIAQEVEPVLPELILHNADNKGSLGLNYMGLVPVLIRGMQQQQTQVESQQKTIERQRLQIDQLKQLVCLDHPDAAVCK